MYKSLFKITTIQKKCQKIIQDFKNHIRYIKKFTQKYQLENVLEEEVEEITTEFIKYINENYLKSCPINQEEKKIFEEASFTNQVWRDFMKQQLVKLNQEEKKIFEEASFTNQVWRGFMEQQLVKYNNLEGQKDIQRLPYKLSKNKDLEVTLKLMDLQGIINEMEEWRPGYEDIQNINNNFKQLMRNIKVKEQSHDDGIPNYYHSPFYSPLEVAGNERGMLQTLITQTNDRLHKYRIVINENEGEKSKYVIDINEYLRGKGIGSISEFLEGKAKPSDENKDIVSTRDLKNFYNAWHSQFLYNKKMKKLLNQQEFRNSLKAKIQKRVGASSYFSQSITEDMKGSDQEKANNMKKSDLEQAKKENIKILLKNLYLFYDLLYKFLSNEYGIEFVPNFRIKDTKFSKKKESSSLPLKQKYLDRIVELYNKLETDYQENVWNVLYPPPKTTMVQMLKKNFAFTGPKTNTETGK